VAVGVGTDTSVAALHIARANAPRLGVAERAQWLAADALEAIGGKFDILISNPPYIRTAEIAGLDAEVRCYDPPSALDGGEDGLRFFRRLAARMGEVVADGWVVLEVGHDQADAVAALLGSSAVGSTRWKYPVLSRCRRKATVCSRQNTELSNRIEHMPRKPLDSCGIRDRLWVVESSTYHAVAAT